MGKKSTGTELTDRQLWAIALTGIMTELNKDSHITLNFNTKNTQNRRRYLKALSRDWGRSIALCRWGVDVGFLTGDEAWGRIMYYAKKYKPCMNRGKITD
jgi:hypothetical protein